jgi:hypothetical protein
VLQGIFGPAGGFRWYDTQLPPGQGYPSAVVWRVSTAINYLMNAGGVNITEPRLQIDIRHTDPEQARAAAAAVIAFLGTVNLAVTGGQVNGHQAPCYVLNQRSALDYQMQPPTAVQTLDVRVMNLEE